MPTSPQRQPPGPLERTALEIRRSQRALARRVPRSRLLLRQSDGLLSVVEESRARGHRLLPASIHPPVVRFLREVDGRLRDELGINRDPERVAEVLFAAQEVLLERAREERHPTLAPIIPLFPRRGAADQRTG